MKARHSGPSDRVFPNLWFGKPMVCVRVACHENDGHHENDENDKGNSDSYKQGVECWIHGNHGNHGNYENHGSPGCKPRVPQTTGLEIPDLKEENSKGNSLKRLWPFSEPPDSEILIFLRSSPSQTSALNHHRRHK